MDNKNLIRRCILTVVSFILSVFLFLSVLCGIFAFTFSKSFIKLVVNQSGFVEHSYASLQTELEDLTIPSGLPINFFHDKLSKELFDKRVKEAFNCNIDKSEPSFNYDTVKKEFFEISYEYALTQNYAVGDEANEALSGFADECAGSYIKHVNPSAVKYVLGYFSTAKKYLGYAAIAILLITAVSFFLLFKLSSGRDFIKHLIFVLSADILFCSVLPCIVLISGEIRKVALTSEALYSLSVCFLEGILWQAIISALLIAVAAAIIFMFKAGSDYTSNLNRNRIHKK